MAAWNAKEISRLTFDELRRLRGWVWGSMTLLVWLRREINFDHVRLLADIEDGTDLPVFRFCITADNHAQIRVGHAQLDERLVQFREIDLLLVQVQRAVRVHGDVVGLARRVLLAERSRRQPEVEII